MNIIVSLIFFMIAVMLPFKRLMTFWVDFMMSLGRWRSLVIFDLMIAVPLVLFCYSIDGWYYYAAPIAIFVIAALLLLQGVYVVVVRTEVCKKHLQRVLSHYYSIAIPLAIAFLCLSIFILGRSYIGPIVDVSDCESGRRLSVACVVTNPEDMVLTPDQQFIIVSEFGGTGLLDEVVSGNLALVDAKTKTRVPLPIIYSDNTWGDATCQKTVNSPFGPHGLDLVKRADGRYQLGVVNHMGGESVEMFELVAVAKESAEPQPINQPEASAADIAPRNHWGLIWRGCVVAPKVNYLNDLSLLKDGSFFVSHMYSHGFSTNDFLTVALTKEDTGYVLHWDRQNGFSQVNGTEGAQPNGVIYDETGSLLYVAFNLGDKVLAVDAGSGEILRSYSINGPDNLVLAGGNLWVTGLNHRILDVLRCKFLSACGLPFAVVQLDASTLKEIERWSFHGEPFGLPTVALPLGNDVLLGSFRSNRLAYFNTRFDPSVESELEPDVEPEREPADDVENQAKGETVKGAVEGEAGGGPEQGAAEIEAEAREGLDPLTP